MVCAIGCGPGIDEPAADGSPTTEVQASSEDAAGTRPDVGGGTTAIDESSGSDGTSSSDDDSTESTGDASSGSSSTGEPTFECAEDRFEENDELGFPADFEAPVVGARSCADDPDWFQIRDVGVTRVLLEQAMGPSPSGDPFANLVLESYCGQELCDVDASASADKSVGFDACTCPEGERRFVHVFAGMPSNPPTGTRYGLATR